MHCIRSVTLYGPTNASPIINHVARFAATAQQEESVKGSHVIVSFAFQALDKFEVFSCFPCNYYHMQILATQTSLQN